jgi:hypothetical protein
VFELETARFLSAYVLGDALWISLTTQSGHHRVRLTDEQVAGLVEQGVRRMVQVLERGR